VLLEYYHFRRRVSLPFQSSRAGLRRKRTLENEHQSQSIQKSALPMVATKSKLAGEATVAAVALAGALVWWTAGWRGPNLLPGSSVELVHNSSQSTISIVPELEYRSQSLVLFQSDRSHHVPTRTAVAQLESYLA
jgi:hypothetical protein